MLSLANLAARHPKKTIFIWLVVLATSLVAASSLSELLTNRFSVPGTQSEKGREVLDKRFKSRSDHNFTLVFPKLKSPKLVLEKVGVLAKTLPKSKVGVLKTYQSKAWIEISTGLEVTEAMKFTPKLREKWRNLKGPKAYLTGYPAIGYDTNRLYQKDLLKGELIAVPIALVILALMLGTLAGIMIPILFALFTIPVSLAVVWIMAHFWDTPFYVTNIVTLIGIALAIDYSMLIVFRYREELLKGRDAVSETVATAIRATFYSGLAVAVGFGLLLLSPVPFMRSLGLGGLAVPAVSVLAALTLLPAILKLLGDKLNRGRLVPERLLEKRAGVTEDRWGRLADLVTLKPWRFLVPSLILLIALSVPALDLRLTGSDDQGIPTHLESVKGQAAVQDSLGKGALAPFRLVVSTLEGVWKIPSQRAQVKFASFLYDDKEIHPDSVSVPVGIKAPFEEAKKLARERELVDPTGRHMVISFSSVAPAGSIKSSKLVERVREQYLPKSEFPGEAYLTGAPAYYKDFLDQLYKGFGYLFGGILLISFLILLIAFRSLLLPLKAIIMNLLSVGAAYGVITLLFIKGWGEPLGIPQAEAIEGWVPLFLYAIMVGLTLDYEIFIISRIREAYLKNKDNREAIRIGLSRVGRIITASAIIMVAAFSGFAFGSFRGLQEFGIGLSVAVLIDAFIIRSLLVPALMQLLGRYNWWLPRLGSKQIENPPNGQA